MSLSPLYVTVCYDSCVLFWKEEQVDRCFPRKYLDILILLLSGCIVMHIKLTILLEVPKHRRVTCLPRKERCLLLSVYFKSSEVYNHSVFSHWLLTHKNQFWLIQNCHKQYKNTRMDLFSQKKRLSSDFENRKGSEKIHLTNVIKWIVTSAFISKII